ncbi:hypothetical protein N8I77_007970 [Diaporthe amygdali]|uniref:Nuclear GTPase SLIP-GC n=1 Tax=Phomopsis amygdali TaxID=1214568 RepID=A0AAD9SCB8_PHOAM|nr:hypothetical protein N8I77_007970 [Diaporthe amygdali]
MDLNTMRSEEPPLLRSTPTATDTRSKSVPAYTTAAVAARKPKVKTQLAMSGSLATEGPTSTPDHGSQASKQQQITSTAANEGLTGVTGTGGGYTTDTSGAEPAQVSTQVEVKAEPESEASASHKTSPVSPDMITKHHVAPPMQKDRKEAVDPNLSDPRQDPYQITLDYVKRIADSTDLTKLETSTKAAQEVLDSLRQPMADSKQLSWLRRIVKLREKSPQKTRTVVAVAGATGAGKSSLVNALLDEEKLLPTSGYRACTAVITEISYNDSNDPQKAYRAEVEFISQDDWDSELKLLFGDLVENGKLSQAYLDTNVEAGIAYAKIRAVYPDLTHQTIENIRAEKLAKREAVVNILGKTRKISCKNAGDLYKAIRSYLDSNKDTKGGPEVEEEEMAYWPLIKVVRVYTRASILKQGICLVDLPGIQDANVARSAVATKCMAECSAVWVAAPIKRAVDDEAARKLLGMNSRLQMKLDGMFSHVSFICTMTDSFEVEESIEAFDEDGQIRDTLAKAEELEDTILEKQQLANDLEQQAKDENLAYDAIEKEKEIWTALQKQQSQGQQVYPPRIPAKRKRATGTATRRCRQQVVDDDPNEEDSADHLPLTTNEISAKLTDLDGKSQAKDAHCEDIEKRLETTQEEICSLQNEKNDTSAESLRLCVYKRNEQVKKSIRVHFANGIMEIDEADAQADDVNFDPSIKQRDYHEMGRSLPVFCVSSKAYRALRKRTKRQDPVKGFRTLMDSEIPHLQQLAMKLPEQWRIHGYKTFLNEFCGLLSSLSHWADRGLLKCKTQVMSAQDEAYEKKHLQTAIANLKKESDMLIWAQKSELDSIVNNEFQSKSIAAIEYAGKRLTRIVTKWTAKPNVGGWDIAHGTYKAICRRNGAKTKSKKARDFNEDILEPYLKKVVSGWDQAFGHSVPESLDSFAVIFSAKLRDFHSMMSCRPELERCKKAPLLTLSRQIDVYEKMMKNKTTSMKASIQGEQRQASRAFYPEIKQQMSKAYSIIVEEEGQGCFLRMKGHMLNHVQEGRNAIYGQANARVIEDLKKIFEANRKELEDTAHNIVENLETDFRSIISNSKKIQAAEMAQAHVRGVLDEADARFEALMSIEPTYVNHVQDAESDSHQLSSASMGDVVIDTDEASEAGTTVDAGAMDTAM